MACEHIWTYNRLLTWVLLCIFRHFIILRPLGFKENLTLPVWCSNLREIRHFEPFEYFFYIQTLKQAKKTMASIKMNLCACHEKASLRSFILKKYWQYLLYLNHRSQIIIFKEYVSIIQDSNHKSAYASQYYQFIHYVFYILFWQSFGCSLK